MPADHTGRYYENRDAYPNHAGRAVGIGHPIGEKIFRESRNWPCVTSIAGPYGDA